MGNISLYALYKTNKTEHDPDIIFTVAFFKLVELFCADV